MSASALSVLVVDDDEGTRKSLRRVLQLDGYGVELAGSGRECLARSPWDGIAAVLLDWKLADGTAAELLPEIRKRAPAVPVVIVTGYADLDTSVSALREGAADYLVKPVNPDALRATLRRLADVRQLREAFLHAQKMEAVGRLAGGIAHDFNNLLGAVVSSCRIARRLIEEGSVREAASMLEELHGRAMQGAKMTRQLLDFSRRSTHDLRVVDVADLVRRSKAMLERLLGEDIEVEIATAAVEMRSRVDATQLEHILMNLAVNARDAMPGGGTLRLAVDGADREAGEGRPAAGRYVEVRVSDTGCGMDEATQARIFEPYFTTKPRGIGTGLGLSTVFGLVREFGGDIEVESAPGQGTTFRLFFPHHLGSAAASDGKASGKGAILVVEDEQLVRVGLRIVLGDLGYEVVEAATPREALEILDGRPEPIRLLLSDVVMPGMSGRDLARRVQMRWPDVKVLFMSGYGSDALVEGRIDPGVHVLTKPFENEELARRIAELLDGR